MEENPSDKTVIVAAARDVTCTYHLSHSGDDLLGIYCEDEQIGEFAMVLSVEQAKKVTMRLTALLCSLPEVRAAHQKKENNQGE